MSKWIPDRKWWAGGLFMLLAFMMVTALNRYAGADISMDEAFVLSVVLGKAAEYLLPPSLMDKIKRLDDDLVAIAARVPDVPVSPEVGKAAAAAANAVQAVTGDETFDAIMRQMKGA